MTTIERVSRPHYHHLIDWARDRPEVLVLSADLTASCEADGFRDAYPDRFYNVGIAEPALVDMAVGFAYTGKIPFANTFSCFFATRNVEDRVPRRRYTRV